MLDISGQQPPASDIRHPLDLPFFVNAVRKSERLSKIIDVWFLKETFRGYLLNSRRAKSNLTGPVCV
jgi:hypothetical protein